jgi:hypothetical protein
VKVLAFYDFEDSTAEYRSHLETVFVKNGKMAFTMDSTRSFSPGITISYSDLTKFPRVGVRISAFILVNDTTEKIPASLVISSAHSGNLYRYWARNFEALQLKPHNWNKVTLEYITPENPDPADELKAFLYYRGKSTLYIDDVKIELFEPKQ